MNTISKLMQQFSGHRNRDAIVILTVAILILASSSLYLFSELVHTRSSLSAARDELAMVSGIIVSGESYEYEESGEVRFNGLLRLTSEDEVNGVKTGDIAGTNWCSSHT